MTFDSDRQHATIDGAHFALHAAQLSGAAQVLSGMPPASTITDGAITFCAPRTPGM